MGEGQRISRVGDMKTGTSVVTRYIVSMKSKKNYEWIYIYIRVYIYIYIYIQRKIYWLI